MPPRAIQVEDLWAIPRVGAPIPSPDGKQMITAVTTADVATNTTSTRLWLVGIDESRAGSTARSAGRPLTSSDGTSTAPAWSPDGRRIAFLRKSADESGAQHADSAQIYVMPVDGGEAMRVTDLPYGAIDPKWLPDGERIAFLSQTHLPPRPSGRSTGAQPAANLEHTVLRKKERDDGSPEPIVTEDRYVRLWDHWVAHDRRLHVHVVEVATGIVRNLTPTFDGWFNTMAPAGSYDIAPDGREIVFGATRPKKPGDAAAWGLLAVDVPARLDRPGRASRIRDLSPDDGRSAFTPRFAPNGQHIVYGTKCNPKDWSDRIRVAVYDRRGRTHHVMTEAWSLSVSEWCFFNDRSVAMLAVTDGRTGVFDLDIRRAIDHDDALPVELRRGGTFAGLSVAGRRLFMASTTLRAPAEAVSLDKAGQDLRTHTAFTAPALRGVQLGRVEDVHFPGVDGDEVQMFLVHPPEKKPRGSSSKGKKPAPKPLVHLIHGGPHLAFGDDWHWRWNAQAVAARGYVVALVNYHGSAGWGQDFTSAIVGAWGDKSYRDIMMATDHLIDRGLADPKRMAATGGSYGGYMASWIAAQTDRFACIVNHAGVCDLQTQFGSDATEGWSMCAGGAPWADRDRMDRYNPLRYADGFKSPMLVIHGEQDYRVPYYQALQIYNTYKLRGLDARLVFYPDENHWILKPKNSIHWYGEVLDWLERWLG